MTDKNQFDPQRVAQQEHTAWQRTAPLYEDYAAYMTALSGQCESRVKPVKIDQIGQLLTAAWAVTGLDDMPEDVQARVRAGTVNNASRYEQADGSFEFPDQVLLAWAQH